MLKPPSDNLRNPRRGKSNPNRNVQGIAVGEPNPNGGPIPGRRRPGQGLPVPTGPLRKKLQQGIPQPKQPPGVFGKLNDLSLGGPMAGPSVKSPRRNRTPRV